MRYRLEPELEDFLLGLPKTETHLHLEGAVPLSLYRKYLPDLTLSEEKFEDPGFRYESFNEFNEGLLSCALPFFISLERYAEAARAVFHQCQAQGVRYLEVSFHLGLVLALPKVHPEEVIDAILGEVPTGMEVRVYAGLLHNDFSGQLREWIKDSPDWERLHGLDLHGQEELPFEDWTKIAWAATCATGKNNRAHAGEFLGADFVERVVKELGVKRIAHGVRAVEDPRTVEFLLENEVTLDVCPISNLKLGVAGAQNLAAHPIRRLFDSGVRVTLSSDDPTFFGNRLIDDYAALHLESGFTRKELVRIARNGFEVADLLPEQKSGFLREIDAIADKI